MSTKVCPTCHGLCCDSDIDDARYEHDSPTFHWCPDCDAGFVWAEPTLVRYDHRYRWSANGPECDLCGFVHQPNLEPLE